MEKWKIVIVVLLLGALGGYGFFQQSGQDVTLGSTDQPAAQPANGATPPPANQKLLKLKGQTPPAWNFPKNYWLNVSKPVTLADTKGHVTVLEFWRMECSHCQDAAPEMNKLFQQYSSQGVKFVAIHSPGAPDQPGQPNPENNWGAVQARVKEWGLKYPIAFDENGKTFKTIYGGDTYPAIMILNKAGKVVYLSNGFTPQKEMQLREALAAEVKKK